MGWGLQGKGRGGRRGRGGGHPYPHLMIVVLGEEAGVLVGGSKIWVIGALYFEGVGLGSWFRTHTHHI